MSVVLQLTAHDPLIARDGRPFGAGQGRRMRGLPWPLPSVVAGSFRTALVKSNPAFDFSWQKFKQEDLQNVAVAGVFPVHGNELYLPAPNDAVGEPNENGKGIKKLHRVVPQSITGGCDLPENGLQPVMLSVSQAKEDFKAAEIPAWWPIDRYFDWLLDKDFSLDPSFLRSPLQENRDHVCLDAERGAAAEGLIFATAGLNVTHLPRFATEESMPWHKRLAEITLSARVNIPDAAPGLAIDPQFGTWHPLGGERRMVHWQRLQQSVSGWECRQDVKSALATSEHVRMILATPAIFKGGWKPGWLTNGLEGELSGVKLKLVGVSNGRWKAVSGWSLQPHKETGRPGPKPIRRMVPAGSVYFFECEKGAAAKLADCWLQSVSDDPQAQRDGFGLATWGIW